MFSTKIEVLPKSKDIKYLAPYLTIIPRWKDGDNNEINHQTEKSKTQKWYRWKI